MQQTGIIIQIPAQLAPVAQVFAGAGVAVYGVGGLVRNTLMGLPPSDLDVCSRLTPDEVIALCQGTELRVIPKAAEFGTVEIHGPGGLVTEHTTFRREQYAPGGAHRPEHVELDGTVETDAFRRDFTVNALYADLRDGRVYDPTGGLGDLEKRVLRATSPDPEDILKSDALRVLRLVRFACELGFEVDASTWEAAKTNAAQLQEIAAERRRDELNKLLLCEVKYPGAGELAMRSVYRGLTMLDELSAWAHLFPELEAGRNCAQRPDHHRYSVLEHGFHACGAAAPELPVRLAALLHDIGKPACVAENGNMHDHARIGAPMAKAALEALRYPYGIVDKVTALVREHMYDIQGQAKEGTLRVRFATWGRELTRQLILLREADIIGCGYDPPEYQHTRWRQLYETMLADGTPFSTEELAVNGGDIMAALGIGPGERVGQIKRRMFRHCARHPKDNTRERLLAMVKNFT